MYREIANRHYKSVEEPNPEIKKGLKTAVEIDKPDVNDTFNWTD